MEDYGALEAEMYRISDNYCGEIRISADAPVIDNRLFALLRAYCKRHPCIRLRYIETYEHSIKESLHNKVIDIAFTNGPYTDSDLQYTPYAKQKWVFVAYARGIFAHKSKVSIDEIASYRLNINIFKSETVYDYNILLQHNTFMRYFSNLERVKQLMYKNDNVSLLPLYAVEQEIAYGDLKVIDVDGLTFDEEIGVLTRFDETNHAIQWFLEFAREYNA